MTKAATKCPVLLANEAKVYSELVLLTDCDDGVHGRSDGVEVASCQIRDLRDRSRQAKAHCDAVQLIAPAGAVRRGWFAGAVMAFVTVQNNQVLATGSQLQGITAWDGLYKDVQILGNTICTESQHKITLCGMLSGEVSGNVDGDGNVVSATLYPARIGGGSDGDDDYPNVWIIGFSDESDIRYWDVAGDVVDMRHVAFNDHDVFLDDFDHPAFWAVADSVYVADAVEHGRALRRLALEFGRRVVNGSESDSPVQSSGELVVMSGDSIKVFDPLTELGLVQAQRLPIGILLNNPMAVKKFENWRGEVPRKHWPDFMERDSERYLRTDLLRFVDPSMGIRCGIKVFLSKQLRGLATVREMIEDYAPSSGAGADNTPTQTENYVREVARSLGVRPDDEIVVRDFDTAKRLVRAVISIECGGIDPYSDELVEQGLILAGIDAPEEGGPVVKDAFKSDERKGAIAVATANTLPPFGLFVVWVSNQLGISEEQAAQLIEEGSSRVNDAVIAAQSSGFSWAEVFVVGTCVAVWIGVGGWGAMKWLRGRSKAGRLGLR